MEQELTVETALQNVANVFENVQANKATHLQLELTLKFLKAALINRGALPLKVQKLVEAAQADAN